ncbi:MAG: RNA-binding S4 domain-containing protein [Saprospiraceae bacterium]|jgi:ribosome-associated heat shock protein Hsp15|nr:RNA-binding S4 domain-containing protein [Saprospiraceae bacterium]
MTDLKKVRIDKWLWAVRLFKSRTMATDACRAGKIKLSGVSLKPSYMVVVGEILEVKKNGFNLNFKVNHLIEKRVSATLAAPCFDDLTPQDELNKYKDWFVGKSGTEYREKGEGRPTKKERRDIDDYKDMYLEDEDDSF